VSFSSRLSTLIEQNHTTWKEISTALKIGKNQKKLWEDKNTFPDGETLVKLCKWFDVSADYLLGLSDLNESPIKGINDNTIQFATAYTDLDAHGQRAVRAVLDAEALRMKEETKKPPVVMMKLRHYEYPAAAGDPLWGEDSYEYRILPEDAVPEHADFSVRLSGDSMEPDYPDGSIVFVRRTYDIGDGDVIIAWIPGEGMVCKKAVVENERILGLTSINPTGPIFVGDRLSDMRVYGKVINP